MNYSELTGFEINKLVAEKKGGLPVDDKQYDTDYVWLNDHHEVWVKFNPCNNPSDAWPIIEEIWDELMREECRGCGVTVWGHVMEEYKCSKLRAAMIVYLMMGDE